MKIILIRHGSKDYSSTFEDKDRPLSDEGRNETERLGKNLAGLDLEPRIYLTGNFKHAAEMGKILVEQLGNTTTRASSEPGCLDAAQSDLEL